MAKNLQPTVEPFGRPIYTALPRTTGGGAGQLSTRRTREDTFPDLGSLSDKELKDLIDNLTAEENEISYKRRVLHGKIDILRAELVNRLRQKRERGDSLISGDDVEQLTQILAGKAQGEDPAA